MEEDRATNASFSALARLAVFAVMNSSNSSSCSNITLAPYNLLSLNGIYRSSLSHSAHSFRQKTLRVATSSQRPTHRTAYADSAPLGSPADSEACWSTWFCVATVGGTSFLPLERCDNTFQRRLHLRQHRHHCQRRKFAYRKRFSLDDSAMMPKRRSNSVTRAGPSSFPIIFPGLRGYPPRHEQGILSSRSSSQRFTAPRAILPQTGYGTRTWI